MLMAPQTVIGSSDQCGLHPGEEMSLNERTTLASFQLESDSLATEDNPRSRRRCSCDSGATGESADLDLLEELGAIGCDLDLAPDSTACSEPMKLVVRRTFLELEPICPSPDEASGLRPRCSSDSSALRKPTCLDWWHDLADRDSDAETAVPNSDAGSRSVGTSDADLSTCCRSTFPSDASAFMQDEETKHDTNVRLVMNSGSDPELEVWSVLDPGLVGAQQDAAHSIVKDASERELNGHVQRSPHTSCTHIPLQANSALQPPMCMAAATQQPTHLGTSHDTCGEDRMKALTRAAELELYAAQMKVAALRAEEVAQRARANSSRPRLDSNVESHQMPQLQQLPMSQPMTMPMPPQMLQHMLLSTPQLLMPMLMAQNTASSFASPSTAPASRVAKNDSRIPGKQCLPKNAENVSTNEEQSYTTLILRNLPNDYSQDMLIDFIDSQGFRGCYDFVYVPMDFERRAGMGYGFLNLVTHFDAERAWKAFHGFSDWVVPSRKVLEVSWCKPLQGLSAHVERYRNSSVMHPSVPDQFKPQIFVDGKPVPFPEPTRRLPAPKFLR